MKTRETSSNTPKKPRAAKKNVPTHDDIALRAYHIYLQRNGAPGNPAEDWARAERELLEESKPKTRRKATITPIAA